jgi:phospholipase C
VCQASKIEHVVIVVEENHTFDAYFGAYCKATAGSSPTCTSGPACCEGAPAADPSGAAPQVLNDSSNFASDRNHTQQCELVEIDKGKMDHFTDGSGPGSSLCAPACSAADDWAVADQATVGTYWSYADTNALADRYFQPIAGGTSSNNMYFAVAHFQFVDNSIAPSTLGSGCTDPTGLCIGGSSMSFTGRTTIADLLMQSGKTFAVYADGYADAKSASGSCPSAPSSCPYSSCLSHPVACHACIYDPSDIPFAYYRQLGDAYIKDYGDLASDIASGTLPTLAYVKAREYRNEHPNVSTIRDGIAFVSGTVQAIRDSMYAASTLILLTWDEGGGFFDHVPPPAAWAMGVDQDDKGMPVPYGTRVPLLAIGTFARKGAISHVQMEHSSIVRFLEYNFVGPVGQLGARDAKVNNLGSLLDPKATGIVIPEQ